MKTKNNKNTIKDIEKIKKNLEKLEIDITHIVHALCDLRFDMREEGFNNLGVNSLRIKMTEILNTMGFEILKDINNEIKKINEK